MYRYRPKNFQNVDISLKKSFRSSSSLDFKFRLGLTLWLIRARVTVWVKFKVGVRTRIAFFCLHDGMQISCVFFK